MEMDATSPSLSNPPSRSLRTRPRAIVPPTAIPPTGPSLTATPAITDLPMASLAETAGHTSTRAQPFAGWLARPVHHVHTPVPQSTHGVSGLCLARPFNQMGLAGNPPSPSNAGSVIMEEQNESSGSQQMPIAPPTTVVETAAHRSPEEQAEIDQMMALASKHGYICCAQELIMKEVALAITSKMIQRSGNHIYQMATFAVPNIPLEVAEKIFLSEYVTLEEGTTKEWKLTSISAVSAVLNPILSQFGCCCTGGLKTFQSKSQPVVRVMAKLLPDFEASYYRTSNGLERLHLSLQYALITEHGEIAWPKDSTRREIAFSQQEEDEIREEVLAQVLELANAGVPLSPGWWRQIGQEERAAEVEAELTAPRQAKRAKRAPLAPKAKRVKKPKLRRFTQESYDIESIEADKKVSTKAKVLYLVRWVGWEEPTWEPLVVLKDTEALQQWKVHQGSR
jgi:hypothetical protein